MTQTIWAETALLAEGWRDAVRVGVDGAGRIATVETDAAPGPGDARVGALLPAPANLHSHAFQRAMAGLAERRGEQLGEQRSERRGADARDSFWTWRALMYRFLDALDPDAVEAIAAMMQVETLEAGFASLGEFHYLHHRPDGGAYDDPAEMAARIAAAAAQTGVGLTLLPVLYERGGCDGRPLGPGQIRFGCDPDRFATLLAASRRAMAGLGPDAALGVAPHSLRAVSPEGLAFAAALAPKAPLHIHVAEQPAEVAEVRAATGARPVEWLLANAAVDARWCAIHATHMTPDETIALARSGAVAGLCPITEASLGDGLFDAPRFLDAGGAFGVGSDSNIRIDLAEELRLLEYGQRLGLGARAVLADDARSTGRRLFEAAALGGAQALGRAAGRIAPGLLADLTALDTEATALAGLSGDALLDVFVFADGARAVSDVWSAGRHVVREGRCPTRGAVKARYRAALAPLRAAL